MNDLFLKACRGEPLERTPVWIMRQAGRYLPEYRAIRDRWDFGTLLRTPELAAQVTLQPVARLGVDAAILFSDILVPVEPMGFRLTFQPAPVLDPPVRSRSDVERMKVPDAEAALPFVQETIRTVRRSLDGRVPLIGFGAAPFTLAAYLVEGGGSRGFEHAKGLLYADPATARLLLEKTTAALEACMESQIAAGAQAIQVFDTWAGVLAAAEYREFALPFARVLIERLRGNGVPVIYFALDASHLLGEIRECGADVVSLDWRVSLTEASRRLDRRFVLQGNLDPSVLLASPEIISHRVRKVLEDGAGAPGHIFNLGHGILPSTPVEHAQALVDAVRGFARSGVKP